MTDLTPPAAERHLGTSDIAISPIAWGMWRLADNGRSAGDAARLVHAALDAGITLLDTADIYGFDGEGGFGDAESLLGEVLTAEPELRGRMVLATKGGIRPPLPYDQSPSYLAEAIDASLRRLKVETIDLYQIHRPDILAHPQEVARALEDAVASGNNAIAIGNTAFASGGDAVAIGGNRDGGMNGGRATQATGASSTAVGGQALAVATAATAYGWRAEATAERATALGHLANASGVRSLAAGEAANASGSGAIALGNQFGCAGQLVRLRCSIFFILPGVAMKGPRDSYRTARPIRK